MARSRRDPHLGRGTDHSVDTIHATGACSLSLFSLHAIAALALPAVLSLVQQALEEPKEVVFVSGPGKGWGPREGGQVASLPLSQAGTLHPKWSCSVCRRALGSHTLRGKAFGLSVPRSAAGAVGELPGSCRPSGVSSPTAPSIGHRTGRHLLKWTAPQPVGPHWVGVQPQEPMGVRFWIRMAWPPLK